MYKHTIGTRRGYIEECVGNDVVHFPVYSKLELDNTGFDLRYDPHWVTWLFRSKLSQAETETILGRYGTVLVMGKKQYAVVIKTTLIWVAWMQDGRVTLPLPGDKVMLNKLITTLDRESGSMIKPVKFIRKDPGADRREAKRRAEFFSRGRY